MNKVIVHSSTNSHYIEGAEDVIAEKQYKIAPDKIGKLIHNEHDVLYILPSNHIHVGFVGTYDYVSKKIEKIRD